MTLSNAMTKEDIYPMLVDMLHKMFELDRSKITPDATLYSDLNIDSIDAGVPMLAGVVQVDLGN
jgi:acyl carrier protein